MKAPKAPNVKLPSVKAPGFLRDLYGDLRDRHLLPLVVVLAAAIIAVPIALKQSSSTKSVAVAPPSAAPATTASERGPKVVAVADAGSTLRDYRSRLDNLRSKDPFEQQYKVKEIGSATGASTSSATDAGAIQPPSGAAAPISADGGSGSGGSESGGSDGGSVEVQTRYASYEIDVRIVSAGSASAGSAARRGPQVRLGLPELTMLPSRKTPAAIFMGVSADGEKALMLVSSDVRSVFGDARCLVGSSSCQLLALEPGLPETFIYGARGRAYRMELLKIHRVISAKPEAAPLGN